MDVKGWATDNVFTERFFRSIKYDYIYLSPASSGIELYQGIREYVKKYNNRKHQGIKGQKPINLYTFEKQFNLNQLDSGLKNRWYYINDHLLFAVVPVIFISL